VNAAVNLASDDAERHLRRCRGPARYVSLAGRAAPPPNPPQWNRTQSTRWRPPAPFGAPATVHRGRRPPHPTRTCPQPTTRSIGRVPLAGHVRGDRAGSGTMRHPADHWWVAGRASSIRAVR
jgi:hypothetical protein